MSGVFDYNTELLFNPEGKIKQLEFIKKTTELGNTTVALCNDNFGVLLAHVPKRTKLAEPQQKVFKIGEKSLFAFSGISNDGLSIVNYLKGVEVYENVIKDREPHYLTCFNSLSYDAAQRTISSNSRLFGVAGIYLVDYDGIKIVEFEPTGATRQVIGVSIGNKSQSCRTILEDEVDNIYTATEEELIKIGVKALRNAYPDPKEEGFDLADVHAYVIEKQKQIKTVDMSFY